MSQYLKTLEMQTHNQIVGRVPGILHKSAERSVQVRGVRDTIRKSQNQLTGAHRGSWRLDQKPGVPWTDLATLHMC